MSLRLLSTICIKASPISSTAQVTKFCVSRVKSEPGHRSSLSLKFNNLSRCFSSLSCQIFQDSARIRCFSSSVDVGANSDSIKGKRRQIEDDLEVKAWMNQLAHRTTQDMGREAKCEPEADLTKSNSSSESLGEVTKSYIEIEDFGLQHCEDEEDEIEDFVPERQIPISTERGKTGPIDVEELVTLLEKENGVEIRVLDISQKFKFVNHMVIVSGKSLRHMRAMAASVQWLYKKKRLSTDREFRLEGQNCKNWFAMDLGNIVVHIFMPETRQYYDLETLWTLGPEFDDPRHYAHDDNLNLSPAELIWLESTQRDAPASLGEVSSDKSDNAEGIIFEEELCSPDGVNNKQTRGSSPGDIVHGDSKGMPGVKLHDFERETTGHVLSS